MLQADRGRRAGRQRRARRLRPRRPRRRLRRARRALRRRRGRALRAAPGRRLQRFVASRGGAGLGAAGARCSPTTSSWRTIVCSDGARARATSSWRRLRAMVELAPDVRLRGDHVLAIDRPRDCSTSRGGWGAATAGPFEIPIVIVTLPGPDGRLQRLHIYDLDQLDAARACFEALTAEPPARRIENAATRQADRISEVWAARDWERLAAALPGGFRSIDRQRMTQMAELDRRSVCSSWMRPIFEMSSSRLVQRGARDAGRATRAVPACAVEVADHDVGPSEIESARDHSRWTSSGERVAIVRFDPTTSTPPTPSSTRATTPARPRRTRASRRGCGSSSAPSPRATGTRSQRAARPTSSSTITACSAGRRCTARRPTCEALRSLVELAPDARLRIDHVDDLRARLPRDHRLGGDPRGRRLRGAEPDGRGARRAGADPPLRPVRPRAARRGAGALRGAARPIRCGFRRTRRRGRCDRWLECVAARDWDALRALLRADRLRRSPPPQSATPAIATWSSPTAG